MKIFKPKIVNPGDKTIAEVEKIENISFEIHKFTKRKKPKDIKRVLIISCLSEFGCETLGSLYCVPRILREYAGVYSIVMGWYGRKHLYSHLVDEFWEIKEEHQWLREYCRAFHHDSKNLKKLEQEVQIYGTVMPSSYVGRYAIANRCRDCKNTWIGGNPNQCSRCYRTNITQSLFNDVKESRKEMIPLPKPSREKLEEADALIKEKTVAIFARGRKCYGRNLQPEFYIKLISLLEEKGYNIIWLGEKATTQPCPVEHVLDLSRSDKARDLELTLAIISRCVFTIQFWTASTRLAGMMGVPYILFESPDQIWGKGQEGYRRNLCDCGSSKLAICHFRNVYEDNDAGLKIAKQCIEEVEHGNYEDVFGLLETEWVAQKMKHENQKRIGGQNE